MTYKVQKTSLGHRYRVPFPDDARAERALYNAVIVLLPFVSAIVLTAIWVVTG